MLYFLKWRPIFEDSPLWDFPATARVWEIHTHTRAVAGKSFPNVLTKRLIQYKYDNTNMTRLLNYQTNFLVILTIVQSCSDLKLKKLSNLKYLEESFRAHVRIWFSRIVTLPFHIKSNCDNLRAQICVLWHIKNSWNCNGMLFIWFWIDLKLDVYFTFQL